MEQKNKIKIVIIVLTVLLGLSLITLGVTLVYNKSADGAHTTVTVPDNLIDLKGDTDNSGESNGHLSDNSSVPVTEMTAAKTKKAVTIELYKKQPEENIPFNIGNMFPGDSETKYFRVLVSHHDKVTVRYKAAVRQGYEKLAEVLKIQVVLLTTGETIYYGPMGDMPEGLVCGVLSEKSDTDTLYYAITTYLDTSAGNEYQNRDLAVDFTWYVNNADNLDDFPQTRDTSDILLWTMLAVGSIGIILILLVTHKRKGDKQNG